jgi:hypothetical protein
VAFVCCELRIASINQGVWREVQRSTGLSFCLVLKDVTTELRISADLHVAVPLPQDEGRPMVGDNVAVTLMEARIQPEASGRVASRCRRSMQRHREVAVANTIGQAVAVANMPLLAVDCVMDMKFLHAINVRHFRKC